MQGVLARQHRLTSGPDFVATSRSGARAGSRTLVTHLAPAAASPTTPSSDGGVRVGFVVSKAVGNAVHRNRVKRRLRHLVAARLADLPAGVLVVRALPAAAQATSAELGADLDQCLRRSIRRAEGR